MARRTTESHTEDNRRRVGLINCSNWNNLPLQRLKGVDLLYQTHLDCFFFVFCVTVAMREVLARRDGKKEKLGRE